VEIDIVSNTKNILFLFFEVNVEKSDKNEKKCLQFTRKIKKKTTF